MSEKEIFVAALQKADEAKTGKPASMSWPTRKKINISDGLPTSNAMACADLSNDGADDLALAGRDSIYIIVPPVFQLLQ